jgi:DNA-binding transcriptional LysR family regulator
MERSPLDLNVIAIFAAIAEEHSLTRASLKLGLPKSTVSRKLAALEERLGVRLLHRTPRSVDLTDAGKALYAEARDALAQLGAAADRVADAGNAIQGRIRVSAPNDYGIAVCAPLFQEFSLLYPEITLELEFTDRYVDLVQEGFDFAVRVGEFSDLNVITRSVATLKGCLVASREYAKAHGVPKTPAEVAEHSVIEFSPYPQFPGAIQIIGPKGEVVDIAYRSRLRVNSLLVSRESVLRGLGIARLPTYLGADGLRDGRLVPVFPDYWTKERTIRLVHTGRRLLPARVTLLMDYLADKLPDRSDPLRSAQAAKIASAGVITT